VRFPSVSRGLVIVATGALFLGCRGRGKADNTLVSDPAAANKVVWKRLTCEDVDMSLPAEMKTWDLTRGNADVIAADIQHSFPDNPELAHGVQKHGTMGGQKLLAVNPKLNKVSLTVSAMPGGETLESLSLQTVEAMRHIVKSGSLQYGKVKVPAGNALVIDADTLGTPLTHTKIYVLLHGGMEYIFNFDCEPLEAPYWGKVADAAMKKVRFNQ